jgi:hypothetical protein
LIVALANAKIGKEVADAIDGIGQGGIWGSIVGNINDQIDLQNLVDGKVSISGDTMTGFLVLSGDPQLDLHAATKGYVDQNSGQAFSEETGEPVGFLDASQTSLSINDVSRTLTITPISTNFTYYVEGKKIVTSTSLSATWDDTHGLHFFYLDENGDLKHSNSFNNDYITKYTYVSVIYWDFVLKKHIYFADERHGIHMGTQTHLYLHNTRGAQFDNGLKLANFAIDGSGNLNTHAQFTSNSGVIWDEDIRISIPAQVQIPVMYKLGTVWKRKDADSFPLIYSGTAGYVGAGGRPPYNSFDGTNWSLTEVNINKWVLVHLFATNDIEYPVIGIQGQQQYNSKAGARQGAYDEIQTLTGLPFAEFAPIGSVIFETSNSYTNTPKSRVVSTDLGDDYVDHRAEYFRPNAF